MDKKIVVLLDKSIKPLIRNDKGEICFATGKYDIFSESYSWKIEAAEPIGDQLMEIGHARTYHTYGYYGFFKPSAAEVLCQIPDHISDYTDFYLVDGPKDAADLNREKEALNAGYHVANTTFYRWREDE